MVFQFFKNLMARNGRFGDALYDDAVVQARRPLFFHTMGVPDTLDGRYDLIVLHLCLLRFAILQDGEAPGDGAMLQAMDERFVMDMDHALREIGVGDLSVGKQVKKMMGGYQGRWTSYRDAFSNVREGAARDDLIDVLYRNVYREAEGADAGLLAQYCAAQVSHLQDQGAKIRAEQRTPWAPWAVGDAQISAAS
ncbi:MAG: ubiquinol-cytochrome C chaperone family protein [Pseudomonadota bacterium]